MEASSGADSPKIYLAELKYTLHVHKQAAETDLEAALLHLSHTSTRVDVGMHAQAVIHEFTVSWHGSRHS